MQKSIKVFQVFLALKKSLKIKRDRMELLSNLFSKILIPEAVYREISRKHDIVLPAFMEVVSVARECNFKSFKNSYLMRERVKPLLWHWNESLN